MKRKLENQNVLLLILLSIITIGIYIPIWFSKQNKELEQMNPDNKLNDGLISFLFIIYCVGFLIFAGFKSQMQLFD
jgi:Na+/proline symporter